ncbi:MAG: FecR family protein [Planctomycetota bacterium]
MKDLQDGIPHGDNAKGVGAPQPLAPELEAVVVRTANSLCDGTATHEDVADLQETLRDNRAAISYYVELLGLHTALDWTVTSRPSASGDFETVTTSGAEQRETHRQLRPLGARSLAVLALGACLLLAAGVGQWLRPQGPPAVGPTEGSDCAAIVSHTDGASWVVLNPSEKPQMRTTLAAADTVHLNDGNLSIRFADGAVVDLVSPAVFQVLAPDRALAVRGKLTATVNEHAVGFAIDTPRAQVVDLGTRFGLEVDGRGQTDVVVFEGEVDVAYGPVESTGDDWRRRVMRIGEAVRVDDRGDANRIVAIESNRFASAPTPETPANARPSEPVISNVRDNIREDESWNYYEIVHGGMGEDALAFVDREAHEWNGLDASGMPAYLVGGDYIKGFNNDKSVGEFEIEVTVDRPCRLFLLFDNRVPVPGWLSDGFRDTGDDIGLDRGPYARIYSKQRVDDFASGDGAGESIDDSASVWERIVQAPTTVRLGSLEASTTITNMYGIVAVPIEEDAS